MENKSTRAVFLSYASQDSATAGVIAEALRAAGIEVWFDQSELHGGDAWDQKIRRQIKECALFMPLISGQANGRIEGYFRLEWKLAVDRSHLMAEDAPFLLPVAIDDTPEAVARVPEKFREVQWSRLTGDPTCAALVARTRALLGGAELAATERESEVEAQARLFRQEERLRTLAVVCFETVADGVVEEPAPPPDEVERPQLVAARELLGQFPGARELGVQNGRCHCAFAEGSTAVKFALLLHHRWRHRPPAAGGRWGLRLGVHGDELAGGEPRGPGQPPAGATPGQIVDLANKVMALGRIHQILLTRQVFDEARQVLKGQEVEGSVSLSWVSHGQYVLGLESEPVEICEVAEVLAGPLNPPSGTRNSRRLAAREHEPVLGWRPALGQVVPDTLWVLERKLGEGGFGEVWLGRHQTMKERRVFKFCFHSERARSLKRELTLFRVLKDRVGDHPHIVRLLEVHFSEPPIYVEMDYVDGLNLKLWCDQQGGAEQVPLAERLEIVAQVAEALQAAHDAGVVHRDVKPGNILVSRGGGAGAAPRAKLGDFGIGQVVSEEVLQGVTKAGFTQSVLAESSTAYSGTQLYMAPELFAGEHATPQSDLYSLGVVLYQLIVGDFRRPVTTDWERAVPEAVLREDLARCFSGRTEERWARAGELAASLRAFEQRRARRAADEAAAQARHRATRRWRKIWVGGLAAAAILLAGSTAWFVHRHTRVRWAREVALPEINRLVAKADLAQAYELAVQVEKYLPTDPALLNLWPVVSAKATFETNPPGTDVYYKEYARPESEWRYLGKGPIKDVRMARVLYRWQFRKEGHATAERAYGIGWSIPIRLLATPALPPEMVPIWLPETNPTAISTNTGLPYHATGQFLIDRHEVSNREYQAFVDRGGYRDRRYWQQPFHHDGRELSWEEAMAMFRDSTGQPGPSTWANGSPPPGRGDYPVTGVSWYEAAAYAEFAGKRLPSIYHWRRATWLLATASIVPFSNFAGQGLAPRGKYPGMTQYGVYDLAGNAKEWCWNESLAGKRYIFGGGWSEPDYMYLANDEQPPFSRGELYGFRCIKLLPEAAPLPAAVDARFSRPSRDYANERPVGDEEFRGFRRLYLYDPAPLETHVEYRGEVEPGYPHERVSINAAYNQERFTILIWLPKKAAPPYQAVVYFPGSGALNNPSSAKVGLWTDTRLMVDHGRALVFPVYKGTFERGKPGWKAPTSASSVAYRDWMIQLYQDLARTIDYLATRPDMRADQLAFLGYSWGGRMGSLLPALETRFKASILLCGGFPRWRHLPEADPINFAPHVKVPTLMVNGRHDYAFPFETMQKPMFALLGTPPDNKRHLVLESGHAPPLDQCGRDIIAWLDQYLGPVSR